MKSLLFDLDDTLYDQLYPFEAAFRKNRDGYERVFIEQIYKSSRVHSDVVFHKTSIGEMSMEDMYVYRITMAFKDFGLDISREDALSFQYDYMHYQARIELLPDMIDALNYCRDMQIRMGIITNGPTEHQKNKLRQLNLYRWIKPEHIFISAELGCAKPDRMIFNLAEQRMEINPEETYFVGDNFVNDILAAKKAGWKTIWCNRRKHSLPEESAKPDYTFLADESLTDLLKIILPK